MTKIRFEPAGFECDAKTGMRLQDVTDEHPDSEVPYSCRSASCGTCRVEVVKGANSFCPPHEDEQAVLELCSECPNVRLCCQITLENDEAEVEHRIIDPY